MGNGRIVLVAHQTHAYAATEWLESSTFKYPCCALVVLLDLESLQPNWVETVWEGTLFDNTSFLCAQ